MTKERTAFLFPGQGRLPAGPPPDSALTARLIARAEQAGLALRDAVADAGVLPVRTSLAQPVILIDELGKDEALKQSGLTPDLVAGHSLGEFAALASAGVLTPDEVLDLVILRGRLMEEVHGTMAAVLNLPLADLERICAELGPQVVVANENGPTQTVVSGREDVVREAARRAETSGARVIPLKVAGPFHSPLMADAAARLAPAILSLTFRSPSVPVVSAVSGRVERDAERLKSLLLTQMTSRVRFGDVLLRLAEEGVTAAVEVGPGDALTAIGRRAAPGIRCRTFEEALHGAV